MSRIDLLFQCLMCSYAVAGVFCTGRQLLYPSIYSDLSVSFFFQSSCTLRRLLQLCQRGPADRDESIGQRQRPTKHYNISTELSLQVDSLELTSTLYSIANNTFDSDILIYVNSIKLVSKRSCDTTSPESIHTKYESKRGSAFAFIFGVN